MHFRPGVTVEQARQVLEVAKHNFENSRTAVSQGDGAELRDAYIRTVDATERQMRNIFATNLEAEGLLTARYWQLMALQPHQLKFNTMIQSEIDLQSRRIQDILDSIRYYTDIADRRPGDTIAILDTNVLMHCRLFDEMPWGDIFDANHVRIVIPLAVLDELDQKSYSGNKRLAKRAGKVLARLTPYLDDIERDGVAAVPTFGMDRVTTLEILGEDELHERPGNIDLEILRRAQFLTSLTLTEVTVVTADRGMRVRGKARGMRVIALDDAYRLPQDEDESHP